MNVGDSGVIRLSAVGEAQLEAAAEGRWTAVDERDPDYRYQAPEQWVDGAGDERADVFALGAILFELLTDKPFDLGSSNPTDLENGVAEGLDRQAAGLAHIVFRAVEPDPKARFATVAALRRALDRFWNAGDLPPGTGDAFVNVDRAPPGWTVPAAIVFAAVVVIVGTVVARAVWSTSEPARVTPTLSLARPTVRAGNAIAVNGLAPVANCVVSGPAAVLPRPVHPTETKTRGGYQFSIRIVVGPRVPPRTYSLTLSCPSSTNVPTAAFTVLPAVVPDSVITRARGLAVQVEATSCGSQDDYGTGIVVSPTTIVTVARAVRRADLVVIRSGSTAAIAAEVDTGPNGLVVLRTSRPIAGFSAPTLTPGAQVRGINAVLAGFLPGAPVRSVLGSVATAGSGGYNLVPDAGPVSGDQVRGSPIVGADGRLLGLARGADSTGLIPIVPAADVVTAGRGAAIAPSHCYQPAAPHAAFTTVGTALTTNTSSNVAATLTQYFRAINERDWNGFDQMLTDNFRNYLHNNFPPQIGARSSYDFGIQLHSVKRTGTDAVARVSFTSIQDPALSPNGTDACDHWTVKYRLRQQSDNSWLINDTSQSTKRC